MRGWIVCKHCWQIFFGEEKPPRAERASGEASK